MLLRVALLFTVTDACPRVRETHYLLPTTSNGFGNQYYAIEKAAWLAFAMAFAAHATELFLTDDAPHAFRKRSTFGRLLKRYHMRHGAADMTHYV